MTISGVCYNVGHSDAYTNSIDYMVHMRNGYATCYRPYPFYFCVSFTCLAEFYYEKMGKRW